VVIHHIIGPAVYKTIEAIFYMALGRKPDEDEWREWIAFMIVGPYAGGFLGKFLLSNVVDGLLNIPTFGGGGIPAMRSVEIASQSLGIVESILNGDGEEALEGALDAAQVIAPVRYATEYIENNK
jgi:hypothetical protein